MLKVVTSQNIDENAHLMENVWRFRHTQFVERLGWRELRSEDGRERDRFDDDDAVHLVAARGDTVVGYTRLLRTSGPHLLRDVYPELMQGRSWPQEADIYEWTRCISDEKAGQFGGVQASHLLITGVLEFCLSAGIRGLVVETHPKLVTWMLETGYEVETLAAPRDINSVPVVAVHIGMTEKALKRHRAMFGIRGSVLDIDEDLINPVTRMGLVRPFGQRIDTDAMEVAFRADVDFTAMRESSGARSN
ncbi:acyl-homoserine-lactone synthase [Rhizobium sp. FKL33]|uniref:acyl-homoserine-lactone synthase n=1 Tax=Rhizobium sp. FKL33 TaxID=2562307 RepID=UPI0010C04F75|nr:acyl-homoserine-lactone synthase [Rhizobium sp. FKL33]